MLRLRKSLPQKHITITDLDFPLLENLIEEQSTRQKVSVSSVTTDVSGRASQSHSFLLFQNIVIRRALLPSS